MLFSCWSQYFHAQSRVRLKNPAQCIGTPSCIVLWMKTFYGGFVCYASVTQSYDSNRVGLIQFLYSTVFLNVCWISALIEHISDALDLNL